MNESDLVRQATKASGSFFFTLLVVLTFAAAASFGITLLVYSILATCGVELPSSLGIVLGVLICLVLAFTFFRSLQKLRQNTANSDNDPTD